MIPKVDHSFYHLKFPLKPDSSSNITDVSPFARPEVRFALPVQELRERKVTEIELKGNHEPIELPLDENAPLFSLLEKLKNKFGACDWHPHSLEEIENFIQDIFPHPIHSLDLTEFKNLTDQDLVHLSKILPDLKKLIIKSDKITMIPFQNLETLDCSGCKGLKQLALPKATHVDCRHCIELQKLIAPSAIQILCYGCIALQELSALSATEVRCARCTALQKIEAPAAAEVVCYRCISLKSLFVPVATEVNCCGCSALQILNLPAALKVDCYSCLALQEISAPMAKNVGCFGCKMLQKLYAPAADTIYCDACEKLLELFAPLATKVDCDHCTSLVELFAPLATKVDCDHCTSLVELFAPKALSVSCENCAALTKLDASCALWINCESCPELKNLSAPNANFIHCTDAQFKTAKIDPEKTLNKLTLDNVFDFLLFADKHQIKGFESKCFDFIERNIDTFSSEMLPILSQRFFNHKFENMGWLFLLKWMAFEENQNRKMNLQGIQECSKEIQELFQKHHQWLLGSDRPQFKKTWQNVRFYTYPPFPHSEIFEWFTSLEIQEEITTEDQFNSIFFHCPKIKSLTINCPKLIVNETTLDRLKRLKEFSNTGWKPTSIQEIENYIKEFSPISISCLNLSNFKDLKDQDLVELSKILPNLKHLIIKDAKITIIPFENLEIFECYNCLELKELSLPKATSIKCIGCKELTNLFAPLATEITCESSGLTKLSLASAISIHCGGNIALKQLDVPKAIWVNCEACTELDELYAPLAQSIHCSDTNLNALSAPKADYVDCSYCDALQTLFAPLAIFVDCSGCKRLKTLSLQGATQVRCGDCTELAELDLPAVDHLYCHNCTQIVKLHAPKLIYIHCEGCARVKNQLPSGIEGGF